MMNTVKEPIRDFLAQRQRDSVELVRGYNRHFIDARISGTLAVGQVTAGAGNGTIQTNPLARLIRSLRVRWDGVDVIEPITGRDLLAMQVYLGANTFTEVLPGTFDGSVQAAAAVEWRFRIPFSFPFLANPYDVFFPGVKVDSSLSLEVEWDYTPANAVTGTTDFSGAFISGGTRSVEVASLKLEMVENLTLSDPSVKPWFIPRIMQSQTRGFTAAQTQLPLDIRLSDRYVAVLFQQMYGTTLEYQSGITDLSMLYTGRRPINAVKRQHLEHAEVSTFPALSAARTGRFMLLHADGGKLGNAVNPLALSEPQYVFNTAAPTSGEGVIRAVYFGLLDHPQYTLPKAR